MTSEAVGKSAIVVVVAVSGSSSSGMYCVDVWTMIEYDGPKPKNNE